MERNLTLAGVHHTARPTWKLTDTVRFYRDVMGLDLLHAISARGWGPADHADFLHFFFDSGRGSTIAFFYYIGTTPPDYAVAREDYQYRATHTAWQVESRDELLGWRQRLEAAGVKIRYQIQHEVIESIYFLDPNGYSIEITWQMRPFGAIDRKDAELTLAAASELESGGESFRGIDQVWRRKADMIVAEMEHAQ